MKLVSMVDYVEIIHNKEVTVSYGYREKLQQITNYAKFLKQPLKLEMFVPCVDEENVLKGKPLSPASDEEWDRWESEKEKHQEAQEKVLFKGFEHIGQNTIKKVDLEIYLETMQFSIKGSLGIGGGDIFGEDIEALAKANLDIELTENAIKQIER